MTTGGKEREEGGRRGGAMGGLFEGGCGGGEIGSITAGGK